MRRFIKKELLQNIQKHTLFVSGERVIVAVSGGADSMALLHALHTANDRLGLQLHVATVDHGLRPDAAADAQFVVNAAAELGLPATVKRVDVARIAAQQGVGIEHAARMARYQAFAAVANEVGAGRVVTAHHADDQVETILMRLLRGSGPVGLQSMAFDAPLPHTPELRLIRPLLTVSRDDIMTYCQQHDITYRHDSTNDDTDILRNQLRHEVLPLLKNTVNPAVDAALLRLSDLLSTDERYMQQVLEQHVQPYIRFERGHAYIDRSAFAGWHAALQRRAIHHCLMAHFATVSPTYDHILHAVRVGEVGEVGAIAQFSDGVQLRVDYDQLVIEPMAAPPQNSDYPYLLPSDFDEVTITPPQEMVFPAMRWGLAIEIGAAADYQTLYLPEKPVITLRRRRPGDRVQPPGLDGHSQKLKDWLINRKVPQSIRDQLPLLLINGRIRAILLKDQWKIMYQVPFSSENPKISLIIRKLFTV